jgi:hypothetical protein
MSHPARQLAQAVVAALNAHTFSAPFTAAFTYRPSVALKDLETLHVTVCPSAWEDRIIGRRVTQLDITIDIAVQQKVDPTDTAAQSALYDLVSDIADFTEWMAISDPPAAWIGHEMLPESPAGYRPDHLREMSIMTLVLRLQFLLGRA